MKYATVCLLLAGTILAGSVGYTYDAAGRLVKVDYGSGGSLVYTYDNAGNLTSRKTISAASVNAAKNAKNAKLSTTAKPAAAEAKAKQ